MAVALSYERRGPSDAHVVLLGGSLGTTGSMWAPQIAALSAQLSTVSFDHRGHGRSPAPPGPYSIAELGEDVLALIDRLSLDRVSYVGISLGGMVGQWLAAHHPERIERLVLIATSAYLGAAEAWVERAATVRAAGTTEVIVDAVLARWFTPDWPPSHSDTMTRLRAEFCANPFEGYAGCCEAIAELDLRDALSQITAPTLVIGGAQDPAIPPEHQRAITAAIGGARLELVAGAAHIPSIQRPDTVNALIANHLGVSL